MSGDFACRKELPKNYSGQILDGKYWLAGCKLQRYELLSVPLQIGIITGYLSSQ